jgi:hypothetical protein
MALGSSFDARVNAKLYPLFYSDNPEYHFEHLFETQVEPHVRDDVYGLSKWLMDGYILSGAFDLLVRELEDHMAPPRFEVGIGRDVNGVPVYGKPDLYFINKLGIKVIYDWKVNGVFSKYSTSPMKGYTWCWDIRKDDIVRHKTCSLGNWHGIDINTTFSLNECNAKWADQLLMYSWLMGNTPGSTRAVFGIEQLVGNPNKLRICRHRLRATYEYQQQLCDRLQFMWDEIINERVMDLDEMALLVGDDDEMDSFCNLGDSQWG